MSLRITPENFLFLLKKKKSGGRGAMITKLMLSMGWKTIAHLQEKDDVNQVSLKGKKHIQRSLGVSHFAEL